MRQFRDCVVIVAAFGAGFFHADAQQLMPAATVNLNTYVALREIAGDAVVGDDRVVLLIRDQGLTGRSAIVLEVDGNGGNARWTDLKAPADSLVMVGNSVAAIAPVRNGVRLLQPAGDGVQSSELEGPTAASVGVGSRLVRLLRSGDLAVQDVGEGGIGAARVPAMAAPAQFSGRGTYLLLPLDGERVAVVERGSGKLKILDLRNAKVELAADLEGEDIRRGKAMYAYHLDKIRARGEEAPNPIVIVSAASNLAGELFLVAGPVGYAEGVRVVRAVNGKVTGTLRLALPGFRMEYGSPKFLGVSGDRLYLITSRGWMNIYRIPNGELAQSLEKGR